MNFDTLHQSGKTLKALHRFFVSNGVDVGSFEYFQAVYNSERRKRKNKPIEPASSKQSFEPKHAAPTKAAPVESPSSETASSHDKAANAKAGDAQETDTEKTRKRGLGLRPIYLADGTEIEIDPNSGAKTFKV
jgi:hypothetical protein